MILLIRRHKKITVLVCILLLFFLIISIGSKFIAIAMTTEEAYTTFSYVTDVSKMKSANKMVITTSNGTTTITDSELIQAVVKETIISNHFGVRCFSWGENKIQLYHDDQLIRSMKQSVGVDGDWGNSKYAPYISVELYSNDSSHYICENSNVYAYLPVELIEKLEEELVRQGNSYFRKTE